MSAASALVWNFFSLVVYWLTSRTFTSLKIEWIHFKFIKVKLSGEKSSECKERNTISKIHVYFRELWKHAFGRSFL